MTLGDEGMELAAAERPGIFDDQLRLDTPALLPPGTALGDDPWVLKYGA